MRCGGSVVFYVKSLHTLDGAVKSLHNTNTVAKSSQTESNQQSIDQQPDIMNRLAALRQTTSPSRVGALVVAAAKRSQKMSPRLVEGGWSECSHESGLDFSIAFNYQHPPGEDV